MLLRASGNVFVAAFLLYMSGSSVVLPCTYTYPRHYTIKIKQWYNNQGPDGEPEDLKQDPEYAGRVEYSGYQPTDCSLRVRDLRESDSGVYRFRFKTWPSEWISGSSGVTLSVTDLQVNVDPDTEEQKWVTLTCITTCPVGSNLYYNWYKNGKDLQYPNTSSLFLGPDYNDHGSSYTCAVKGHKDLRSPAVCARGKECWSVTYTTDRICALKGSSVDMPCTYTYPRNHKVTNNFWLNKRTLGEPEDLSLDREYQGRVEYRGNKENDCTLRITDLRESDSGKYRFRIVTDVYRGQYSSFLGTTLSVTDLQVKMASDTVTEGQSETLTCSTTCTLGKTPTFIWYKNELPTSNKHTTNHNLYLHPVSSVDTGSYSCAVRGHENLHSPAVTLTVRYAPKNTSVSLSSSGKIVEGSSVTLTCSSDANPPVEKYTWYKKNGAKTSLIGSGQNCSITNIISEHSGQYCCKAQNEVGAQNSTLIPVDALYDLEALNPVEVWTVLATLLAALSAVTLIIIYCVKRRNTGAARGTRADTQSVCADHDDTYTALYPSSRYTEYDTLASVRDSPSDTYTALQRTAQASEYETLQRESPQRDTELKEFGMKSQSQA